MYPPLFTSPSGDSCILFSNSLQWGLFSTFRWQYDYHSAINEMFVGKKMWNRCTISCKNVLTRAFLEIRWTLVVCTRKRYSAHVITSWTNFQCRHLFCFSRILKKTQTTAEKTRKTASFIKHFFPVLGARRFTKTWGFFLNEVLLCVEDNC